LALDLVVADDVRVTKMTSSCFCFVVEGAGEELARRGMSPSRGILFNCLASLRLDQAAQHNGGAVAHPDERRGLLGFHVRGRRAGGLMPALLEPAGGGVNRCPIQGW